MPWLNGWGYFFSNTENMIVIQKRQGVNSATIYFTPDIEFADRGSVVLDYKLTELQNKKTVTGVVTAQESGYFATADLVVVNVPVGEYEIEFTDQDRNEVVYRSKVYVSNEDLLADDYKVEADKRTPDYGTNEKNTLSYE